MYGQQLESLEAPPADLSDLQRDFLRTYHSERVFSVISWGCAATAWVARTLNSHPDIFCVHASNTAWQILGGKPRLDGAPYLHIIRAQGQGHLAAGDVHGVSRHLVPHLRAVFGDRFGAAVLVREPMARLKSQLALFDEFSNYRKWEIGYIDAIIRLKDLSLPDEEYHTKLFVHGVNMLNAIVEERAVGEIFRAEDITTAPEALRKLVNHVTGGAISPSLDWSRQAIGVRRSNSHAGGRRVVFSDWQTETLRKVVEPEAWNLYSQLGYQPPDFL